MHRRKRNESFDKGVGNIDLSRKLPFMRNRRSERAGRASSVTQRAIFEEQEDHGAAGYSPSLSNFKEPGDLNPQSGQGPVETNMEELIPNSEDGRTPDNLRRRDEAREYSFSQSEICCTDERNERHHLFDKRNLQQVLGDFKAKALQLKIGKDAHGEGKRAADASPNSVQDPDYGEDDIRVELGFNAARRKFNLSDRNIQANITSWLAKKDRSTKLSSGDGTGPSSGPPRHSLSRAGLGRHEKQVGGNAAQDEDIAPSTPMDINSIDDTRSLRNIGGLVAQQGKNLGQGLLQIGREARGVLRRTKSSTSLYNNYDRHARKVSDPDGLEEHVQLLSEIGNLKKRLVYAEEKLSTFLVASAKKRDVQLNEMERLTKLYINLKKDQDVKFRSVLDIFNENYKTLGYVESSFDYLLSVVDRGRARRGTPGWLISVLQLVGDNTMDKIFRVVHKASEMFIRIRRMWQPDLGEDEDALVKS